MTFKIFHALIIWTALILSFSTGTIKAQNLVSNWSFEDTIPCISNPNFGTVETAIGWKEISQSPDYMSLVYCGGTTIGFGYQTPKTGKAFIGFAGFNTVQPNGIREIFGKKLNDTLVIGHKYCVSFYVSLAESSQYAIENIGILFTSFEVDQAYIYTFNASPQVQNPSGNIITDTTNWIEISGDFIAQGNELYISIGNFYDDQNTPFLPLSGGSNNFAYYYVDDVSVIDCTVGLDEFDEVNLNVFPNPVPSGQMINLELPDELRENIQIKLFNVQGKIISDHEINVVTEKNQFEFDLSAGVYFLQIYNDRYIGNSKIIVIH